MIFLVRHGETVWNREKRKQGHNDSPLTLNGIEQAKIVGQKLKLLKTEYFKFFVSPLGRAKQTASIVSEYLGIGFNEFQQCDSLKEHAFGEWEGLTENEIEQKYPGELARRFDVHWKYIVPGGESNELLYYRVKNDIGNLIINAAETDELSLVIITHEMVSRVIRGIAGNLSHDDILNLRHKHNIIYKINYGNILEV